MGPCQANSGAFFNDWLARFERHRKNLSYIAQRTQLDATGNPLHEACARLLANGLDGAGEASRIPINKASSIKRAQHLHATPYERSAQRVDHALGFVSKPDQHTPVARQIPGIFNTGDAHEAQRLFNLALEEW